MNNQTILDLELVKNLELNVPNIKTIKKLLKNGANANIKHESAFAIFTNVMKTERGSKIIEMLLEHNLDPNLQNILNGDYLIHLSVELSKISIIQLLIKFGADVNVMNKNNKTPLEYATGLKDLIIIKQLLLLCNLSTFKKGIRKAFDNRTLDITLDITKLFIENDMFYRAFENDRLLISNVVSIIINEFTIKLDESHMEIIKLMISKIGIEIFRKRFTDNLILLKTSIYDILTIDSLEFLIYLGAEIDIKASFTGNTPLLLSANNPNLDIVTYLVNHVDNKPRFINRESEDGSTALNRFAFTNVKIVKFLIENGGDVNYRNKYGITALMSASKSKFDISYLIMRGADIDVQTTSGRTALMGAIKYKQAHAVKTLLDNKLDILIEDNQGANALDEAILVNYKLVLILLCNYIVKNNINLNTDKYDDIINTYTSKDILELRRTFTKVIRDSSDDIQNDLLIKALTSDKPNVDTIRELLENGADISIKNKDAYNIIGYIFTVEHGSEIIELLLDHGLDANFKNKYNGDYLVHTAVRLGNVDIVQKLIRRGADIKVTNNKNETPLIKAIATKNIDMIKLFL